MSDAVKVTRQAIDASAPQIEFAAPAETSVAAERLMTAAALKSMGPNDGQISRWS